MLKTILAWLNPPTHTRWALLFGSWLIVTVSTLAALFLGEVMGYAPFVLRLS